MSAPARMRRRNDPAPRQGCRRVHGAQVQARNLGEIRCPEQGVRVRSSWLEKVMDQGGSYGVDDLIHDLMDWLDVTDEPEPALHTLRRMLDRHYPPDGRSEARCCCQPEEGGALIFHVAASID